MDPVTNSVFTIDYHRFVTQDLLKEMPPAGVEPQKRFDLGKASKSEKSKKEEENDGKQKKKRPFTMD